VISSARALFVVAPLLLALPASSGCAGNQSRVNDVQQVNLRLQGSWVLRSYRPNVALEAPLAAMLNVQLGQLRVTINGTQLEAQGPALQVVRSYQIQEVVDQTATLVVTEPTGVSVRVWIEFRDNLLTFRPLDAPWGGEGTLQRAE
jgi:hypothetical protein